VMRYRNPWVVPCVALSSMSLLVALLMMLPGIPGRDRTSGAQSKT
jgi:hypothetical protein